MTLTTTNPFFAQCLHASALHARIQLALDDDLGSFHGLSYADFRLLRQLADAPGQQLALADLVPCLGLPLSAVLRQVLPLEKTGLLARDPAPDAAGARRVRLRPAARQLLAQATETAQARCAQLCEPDAPADALASAGAA